MSDTDTVDNPRARIGGNFPPLAQQIGTTEDFAAHVKEYLDFEYREIARTATELLEEARALPTKITNEDELGKTSALVKRIRDCAARAEGLRVKEGEPYLRGKNTIDQFFFAIIDRLAKRSKTAKAGGADILLARIGEWQDEQEAQERARREAEAREARRVAEEAQRKAAEEAAEAERLRLEAERARKPETKQAKGAAAAAAEEQAAVTITQAEQAVDRAQEAHINTLAKPADLVRHRGESGALSTRAREFYALVVDESLLDRNKLWPFIPLAAKEQALRAWAKTTGHKTPMEGAEIGERAKPVVR